MLLLLLLLMMRFVRRNVILIVQLLLLLESLMLPQLLLLLLLGLLLIFHVSLCSGCIGGPGLGSRGLSLRLQLLLLLTPLLIVEPWVDTRFGPGRLLVLLPVVSAAAVVGKWRWLISS